MLTVTTLTAEDVASIRSGMAISTPATRPAKRSKERFRSLPANFTETTTIDISSPTPAESAASEAVDDAAGVDSKKNAVESSVGGGGGKLEEEEEDVSRYNIKKSKKQGVGAVVVLIESSDEDEVEKGAGGAHAGETAQGEIWILRYGIRLDRCSCISRLPRSFKYLLDAR